MELQGYKVLSQGELEKIHEASLRVLERVGLLVQNREALKVLADAGAQVDFEKERVHVPRRLVEEALTSAPKEITLYTRSGKPSVFLRGRNLYSVCGHDANYVLDAVTGERRVGTKQDVADFARLGDALDNMHVVSPSLVPQDVVGPTAHMHAFEAILNNTEKPLAIALYDLPSCQAVLDMAQIVAGDRELADAPFLFTQSSPTSPLSWEPGAAAVVMESARRRVPCAIIPCPMAGMTAPMSSAGLLVQHNAETLSGILLTQLVRKGSPVIYSLVTIAFDMREGTPIIGAPEAALWRIAGGQLGRFYGMSCYNIGFDADTHCLDQQTAWEKLLTTIVHLDTGSHLFINAGMIATGLTVSLEQQVIDDEIFGICLRLLKGIEVTDETMSLDLIAKVGPKGHFLAERRTLADLRREYWLPKISSRSSYERWKDKGRKTIVQVASDRVRELMATHWAPPLSQEVQRQLRERVAQAEEAV